jgi:hypothetical protein
MLPHHPYIFDRFGKVNGRPTLWKPFRTGSLDKAEAYIEQLIFVSKKVRGIVDRIMEKSEVPPIIVIQSDHGPHLSRADRDDFLRARMCNFNAYHLPDGGNQLLYPSITPVNSFRVIFNRYFGTNHELLPDTCYFSQYAKPYRFMDVSDIVDDRSDLEGGCW